MGIILIKMCTIFLDIEESVFLLFRLLFKVSAAIGIRPLLSLSARNIMLSVSLSFFLLLKKEVYFQIFFSISVFLLLLKPGM